MRVLGNPMGEFRGKLAGLVFTRNKGGESARMYNKPINTNSIAQRNQRNLFRAMSGTWNALTAAQKASWNEFARVAFNPLLKTNGGKMSGVNACKANYIACNGSNSRKITMTVIGDAVGAANATSFDDINFSYDPPIFSVRPNVQADTDINLPLQLINSSVHADGSFNCDVNFLGTNGTGIVGDVLKDINSIKYGFGFFLSEAVVSAGSAPKSPLKSCLGTSGIMTWASGKLSGSEKLTVTVATNPLVSLLKAFPMVGSQCLLTLVLYGENGTQTIASSEYVTIEA